MIERKPIPLTEEKMKKIIDIRSSIKDPKDMDLIIHFKAMDDLVDVTKGVIYGFHDPETGKNYDWDSLPELNDDKLTTLMYMLSVVQENIIKAEHYYRRSHEFETEKEIEAIITKEGGTNEEE